MSLGFERKIVYAPPPRPSRPHLFFAIGDRLPSAISFLHKPGQYNATRTRFNAKKKSKVDHDQYITDLLKKHLEGTLNSEESQVLQDWANTRPENRSLLERISQEDLLRNDMKDYWDLWNQKEASSRKERIFDLVGQQVSQQAGHQVSQQAGLRSHDQQTGSQNAPHIRRRMSWIAYATAAAILIIGIGTLLFTDFLRETEIPPHAAITDVPPGRHRAVLTLADGRQIDLSTDQTGIVIGDGITYADGTVLLADPALTGGDADMLVLTTPRGGTYQVTLPDGSEVWLNANSTLRYPSRFTATQRVVQLEGEAYFNVKKQVQLQPFRVTTAAQTIEVLGTEFNVNAYPEEPGTKTTLVTGSVEVISNHDHSRNRIVPGEQLTTYGNTSEIARVNIAHFTAWKDGRFSFDGKSFEQIMREMARWYDIEIQYEGDIPTDRFMGDAYRTDRLSTVLHFLESSNVGYRLEEGQSNGRVPRLIIQHHDKNNDKKEVTP